MNTKVKHYVQKGVNGLSKDIEKITRIVLSDDGTSYSITLSCGERKEVRSFQYKK